MVEKKPAPRVRSSRTTAAASGAAAKAGETKRINARGKKGNIVTDSAEQSAAPVIDTPAPAVAAAPAAPDAAILARLNGLRQLAVSAFVLSVIGVAAALTTPLWSAKLYGNPDSSRFVALGVAQLRPFLKTDEPFGVQLSTLRRVSPNDPDLAKALETLAAFADQGAPTLPRLNDRFVRMANEIILVDLVSAKHTWLDRAVVTVASTIELHAMAHRLKDSREASAVLWDAQAHLDSGDLAGAVGALALLSGRPAEIAAPWIEQAKQRLAADKMLVQLDAVAEQLTAGNRLRQLAN
jgi:hypothetical protein